MLINECSLIPDWLKSEIGDRKCEYCGETYHVGLSPNGQRVTQLYCPNQKCPGTVAMKMVFVWEVLGVDGIKFGRSMELIRTRCLTNHLDAVPIVAKDKPKVTLATFMRLQCIKGIDSGWYDVCSKMESFEELITNVSVLHAIDGYTTVEELKRTKEYFEIVYPTKMEFSPKVHLTVMITGDILGLSNREDFIAVMNMKYKGLLDLRYSKSKRKTGINALIKEQQSATTGKVTTAIEAGIPIYTPKEFIIRVDNMIKEAATEDEYAAVHQRKV